MPTADCELLRSPARAVPGGTARFFQELYRCQDDGWVDVPGETPDPDFVEDCLHKLNHFDRTMGDVIWHLLIEIDPHELLHAREMQKMALARYARQSLFQWEGVEVNEIRRWFERLRELLENEGAFQSTIEDG